MASSNLAILTKSHKIIAAKKRARREQIKEVVFDDGARREFLTGFHKRKLQKKEVAKKKAQDREKQERLEARREKRQLLAERAAQNVAEVEKAYGGHVEDGDGSDTEWSGLEGTLASPDKGKGKAQEEEYEYEEEVATVTVVEDFDPDALIHGQDDRRPIAGAERDGAAATSEPPDVANRARHKPKPATAYVRHDRKKSAPKPKDIKYQTSAARKVDRLKQRRRKSEKAERAGGKASRKGTSGRKKR
ncbi:hypothetical protein IEO21_06405 [Rhodonia placenta]|uniref:Nucleolar protein 12 n=1 Tax=Rhodonia placenta TaxID=104341 RepID=A0A8H7P0C5_9APHY|nr:hypothetical protein IEO21_06405 [Postia placenta]